MDKTSTIVTEFQQQHPLFQFFQEAVHGPLFLAESLRWRFLRKFQVLKSPSNHSKRSAPLSEMRVSRKHVVQKVLHAEAAFRRAGCKLKIFATFERSNFGMKARLAATASSPDEALVCATGPARGGSRPFLLLLIAFEGLHKFAQGLCSIFLIELGPQLERLLLLLVL